MPGRYDDEDDDLARRLAKRASASESRSGAPSSETRDLIDMLGRRISGAILFAGVAIGIGLFAGSGGNDVEAQTYQAFAVDGEVFRLNTDSGTLIACSATAPCRIVLQRGQDLAEDQNGTLFKAPAPQLPAPAPAAQQPALPAPAETAAPAQTK